MTGILGIGPRRATLMIPEAQLGAGWGGIAGHPCFRDSRGAWQQDRLCQVGQTGFARFEREVKRLGSLHYPNLAATVSSSEGVGAHSLGSYLPKPSVHPFTTCCLGFDPIMGHYTQDLGFCADGLGLQLNHSLIVSTTGHQIVVAPYLDDPTAVQ